MRPIKAGNLKIARASLNSARAIPAIDRGLPNTAATIPNDPGINLSIRPTIPAAGGGNRGNPRSIGKVCRFPLPNEPFILSSERIPLQEEIATSHGRPMR
jgi:hypothetical protein